MAPPPQCLEIPPFAMNGSSNSPDISDQDTVRDIPLIPDYELIRCVGKGAYGEVWLGKTVTGSLRAIKIVRRETFEMERTFRREVEGIENFEPISRGHPGLVDILHVGWRDEEGFFYYIMELADDRLHGQSIQLSDYEPRTLASARTPGQKLFVDQCIDVGISLADALSYLHERDLIHRDIKPSNIVFVDGEAKLVDIGLVAPSGQKTFVGTEGFVPPEGPGSASADLYSLGMVLYEISTGNDRLEFPELPATGFSKQELPKWQRLNAIICKACSPNPAKRYISARIMTEDLRDLRAGRKPKVSLAKRLMQCAVVVAILAVAGLAVAERKGMLPGISFAWLKAGNVANENTEPADNSSTGKNSSSNPAIDATEDGTPLDKPPVVATFGTVHIDSSPPGATILLGGTENIGKTGAPIDKIPQGRQSFTLQFENYDTVSISGEIRAGEPLVFETVAMQLSKGPRPGEPWSNSLGMEFPPSDGQRLSRLPMSADLDMAPANIRKIPWNGNVKILRIIGKEGELKDYFALLVPESTAVALCEALTSYERAQGFLPDTQFYEPAPGNRALGFMATEDGKPSSFHLKITTYASLTVISDPPGAEIFLNGEVQATPTPTTLTNLKSDRYEITLKKAGFEDRTVTDLAIEAGQQETRSYTLEKSKELVFGEAWNNSLNMRFVPLNEIMLSQWETRREDYDIFARKTGRGEGHIPEFHQEPNHPVVGVNREDAEAFCQWLTEREQLQGLLPEDVVYRLPTDLEWSLAAGLEAERGSNPKERHQQSTGKFPWGFKWPPSPMTANIADAAPGNIAARQELLGELYTGFIPGYVDDDYAFTAPVGHYQADQRGLNQKFYDLAGNVREWVADDFDPQAVRLREGVLRGGSWNTFDDALDGNPLWTTSRDSLPANIAATTELTWENGFRCALARRVKITPE
ncbi:MAG: serine/threonine protein kinase/formylglycine-generating enzyme required for sulfatase activity [Verrucomicrobiales bacterium]